MNDLIIRCLSAALIAMTLLAALAWSERQTIYIEAPCVRDPSHVRV
jgi:hypothetical protein